MNIKTILSILTLSTLLGLFISWLLTINSPNKFLEIFIASLIVVSFMLLTGRYILPFKLKNYVGSLIIPAIAITSSGWLVVQPIVDRHWGVAPTLSSLIASLLFYGSIITLIVKILTIAFKSLILRKPLSTSNKVVLRSGILALSIIVLMFTYIEIAGVYSVWQKHF